MKELEILKKIDKNILQLQRINGVLGWDRDGNLKQPAMDERAGQCALISLLAHEYKTSKELENAVNTLYDNMPNIQSKEDQKLVEMYKSDLDRTRKLPKEFVEETTALQTTAYVAWVNARKNNSYDEFQPYLQRIVDMKLQQSDLIGYTDNPYDVQLGDFEKGNSVKRVDSLFIPLEAELSKMLKELSARHKDVDDSFLYGKFDVQKQYELSNFAIKEICYDFDRGHFSYVPHPSCSKLGFDDVRVSTRLPEHFLSSGFWIAIHEVGHALYEQGINPNYKYSSLGKSISLGIHESQSKFWENMVGRSRAFTDRYLFKFKEIFPQQFGKVTEDMFYNAINKVQPSYNRIEADEVSYSLHIILRYNMEKMLMNKQVKVSELRDVWNAEYKRLFGIDVDCDNNGVIQDVHWVMGAFGYFPCYAQGNLFYGQFTNTMSKSFDVNQKIREGDFATILKWLNEKIHVHGSMFDAQEMIRHVTGEDLTHKYFVDYLKKKFDVK